MAEADWARIAIEVAVAAGSGLSGSLLTAYRMGRREAQKESAVKTSIEQVRTELGEKMMQSEKRIEQKVEGLTHEFSETFKGMRQKINDVELNTERHFLKKEEFNDFHDEYRADQRRVFDKLDTLIERQASIMSERK